MKRTQETYTEDLAVPLRDSGAEVRGAETDDWQECEGLEEAENSFFSSGESYTV